MPELNELEARIERIEREIFYKDRKYRFSNDNVIFRNGVPILPSSEEGKQIEAIMQRQRDDKIANEKQKKRHAEITAGRLHPTLTRSRGRGR